MRSYPRKQAFYFRQDDETDQALYRLLMRYSPAARTELFRDLVLRGFRQYLKHRRLRREPMNGLAPGPPKPTPRTTTLHPIDDVQPWK